MIESDCAGGATLDPRRSASSSRFPAVEKVWARTGAQAASQRQQGGVDLSFGLNSIRGSKKWFNIETEGMWVLQKQIWKIQQGGLRKHQVNTEGKKGEEEWSFRGRLSGSEVETLCWFQKPCFKLASFLARRSPGSLQVKLYHHPTQIKRELICTKLSVVLWRSISKG